MSDMEPTARSKRGLWLIIGALVLVLLAVIVLLATNDDDGDDDDDTAAATTTTASDDIVADESSSTTASTSTTAQPTTTSAAPGTTIPVARCTGKTDPAKPALPAETFYDAWRVGDRACAEKIGTPAAVNTLFSRQPNGPGWEFQGCMESGDPDGHGDCAFTFEGGSTHFKLTYGDTAGWSIFEVYSVAD